MQAAFLLAALSVAFALSCARPTFAQEGADEAPDLNEAAAAETGLSDIELLGKRIFEDKSLSEPPGVSCASCHDPSKAFQGNNGSPVPAVARGSRPNALGQRKAPSLLYASLVPAFHFEEKKDAKTGKTELVPIGGLFWDGRADSLAAQAQGPLLGSREMNNPSKRAVAEKVRDGAYSSLASRALGADLFVNLGEAFDKLTQAVAAYESTETFHPFSSKFDAFLEGREKLTAKEMRGFELFKNPRKGNCIACHVGEIGSHDPSSWPFTDFSYDALGAPRNSDIPDNDEAQYFDLGLCKRPGIEKSAPADFDLESLCGHFRAPSLRNVAVTGPYLHNGAFKTLREVVAFYATRDTHPLRWYPKAADGKAAKYNDLPLKHHVNVNEKEVPYDRKQGQAARLSDKEIDAIVAFLETLTDRPKPAGD